MQKKERRWTLLGLISAWLGSALALAGAPGIADVPLLTVRGFDVSFEVADAGDGDLVTLWHTTDDGKTWSRGERVPAVDGKIGFLADRDGMHGFRLTVNDEDGAVAGDVETFWAWVDGSPPVLQLHPLRVEDETAIRPVVLIGWTAIDVGLVDRPISLSYRSGLEGSWIGIEAAVANTGSYDWRVAEGTTGEMTVRVRCVDRAGHRSSAVAVVRIPDFRRREIPDRVGRGGPARAFSGREFERIGEDRSEFGGRSGIPEADRLRADRILELARQHADRAEYRLAASRLRDVLAIDPNRAEALVTLGGVLYAQGKPSESLESFELALAQRPDSFEALEGSALVHIGQQRFGEAVSQLSRIVRHRPDHAQTWLHLGDVAIYQGDEILAREHYKRVLDIGSAPADIVGQTRLRLANLARLATDFRQTNK